jgi:cytochrome b561
MLMHLANSPSRYGSVSQVLHWLTVALVIILFVTGKITDVEPDHPGNTPFLWHGSLGVLVFFLVIARVVWAFVSPPPELPGTMTRVARLSARTMHVLLYALLLSVPLSGWLVSSSEGASVNFFGVVSIPKWASRESQAPTATPQNGKVVANAVPKEDEELLEELHEVLGNALVILASLHALVALKHHFFNRDDVLNRMLPKSEPPRRPPVIP